MKGGGSGPGVTTYYPDKKQRSDGTWATDPAEIKDLHDAEINFLNENYRHTTGQEMEFGVVDGGTSTTTSNADGQKRTQHVSKVKPPTAKEIAAKRAISPKVRMAYMDKYNIDANKAEALIRAIFEKTLQKAMDEKAAEALGADGIPMDNDPSALCPHTLEEHLDTVAMGDINMNEVPEKQTEKEMEKGEQ